MAYFSKLLLIQSLNLTILFILYFFFNNPYEKAPQMRGFFTSFIQMQIKHRMGDVEQSFLHGQDQ